MADQDSNHVIITRKEARERGLKRYFTGKPCKRGHVAERYLANNQCKTCLLEEWKERNPPEKESVRARKRREIDPDKFLAYTRTYNSRNRARRNELARKRYDPQKAKDKAERLSPESRRRAQKAYYLRNSEKRKANSRLWREANPVRAGLQKTLWSRKFPERAKEIGHRRRARIAGSGGSYTTDDIKRIYHLQDAKCAYCKERLNGKYQIDHIMPLSKGGSNHSKNIQLLCVKSKGACNQKKRNSDPMIFARSLGLLL